MRRRYHTLIKRHLVLENEEELLRGRLVVRIVGRRSLGKWVSKLLLLPGLNVLGKPVPGIVRLVVPESHVRRILERSSQVASGL